MRKSLWIVVLIMLAIIWIAPAAAQDEDPRDAVDIVFMCQDTREDDREVCSLDLESGEVFWLTNNVIGDGQPDWSPDGEQIVYISSVNNEDNELFIMDPRGGFIAQLTKDEHDEVYPAWSPDGSQIVYGANPDGDYNLYLMDLESGDTRQITTYGTAEDRPYSPSWAPDGSQLIHYHYVDRKLGRPFTILDLETLEVEGFNPAPAANATPRWSPDGTQVVYTSDANGNLDIWVLDLETRETTQLTTYDGLDYGPDWSPDGSQIVFHSDRAENLHLFVMNADGTDVQQVTFGDGREFLPVWRPDPDVAPAVIAVPPFRGAGSAPEPCTVTANTNANLRAGPGTGYDVAGSVSVGEQLEVDGIAEVGDVAPWWHLSEGAWLRSDLGTTQTTTCESLPAMEG